MRGRDRNGAPLHAAIARPPVEFARPDEAFRAELDIRHVAEPGPAGAAGAKGETVVSALCKDGGGAQHCRSVGIFNLVTFACACGEYLTETVALH